MNKGFAFVWVMQSPSPGWIGMMIPLYIPVARKLSELQSNFSLIIEVSFQLKWRLNGVETTTLAAWSSQILVIREILL